MEGKELAYAKTQPYNTTFGPMSLIRRQEWTSVPPKASNPLDLPAEKIFLVPTGRRSCFRLIDCKAELLRCQEYHMKVAGITDIRYNFIITGVGMVFEGRGWKESPQMPKMYNKYDKQALYIAFSGVFKDPKTPVPPQMLDAMEQLLRLGLENNYISPDYTTYDL